MSTKNTKLLFTPEEEEKLVDSVAPHPAIYDLKNILYKDQRAKDNIWVVIASEVGRPVADCNIWWKNIKDTHDRRTRECGKTGSEAPPSGKKRKWELQEKLSFLHSAGDSRRSFCNIEETTTNDSEIDVNVDDPASGSSSPSEMSPANVAGQVLSPNESSLKVLPEKSPSTVITQKSSFKVISEKPKKMSYREQMCAAIEKRSKERDAMVNKMFENDEESDEISLLFKSIAKTVQKLPPYLQQRAKIETLSLILKIENDMWSSRSGISSHSQFTASPSPSFSVQSQFSDSGSSIRHEADFGVVNEDCVDYLFTASPSPSFSVQSQFSDSGSSIRHEADFGVVNEDCVDYLLRFGQHNTQ